MSMDKLPEGLSPIKRRLASARAKIEADRAAAAPAPSAPADDAGVPKPPIGLVQDDAVPLALDPYQVVDQAPQADPLTADKASDKQIEDNITADSRMYSQMASNPKVEELNTRSNLKRAEPSFDTTVADQLKEDAKKEKEVERNLRAKDIKFFEAREKKIIGTARIVQNKLSELEKELEGLPATGPTRPGIEAEITILKYELEAMKGEYTYVRSEREAWEDTMAGKGGMWKRTSTRSKELGGRALGATKSGLSRAGSATLRAGGKMAGGALEIGKGGLRSMNEARKEAKVKRIETKEARRRSPGFIRELAREKAEADKKMKDFGAHAYEALNYVFVRAPLLAWRNSCRALVARKQEEPDYTFGNAFGDTVKSLLWKYVDQDDGQTKDGAAKSAWNATKDLCSLARRKMVWIPLIEKSAWHPGWNKPDPVPPTPPTTPHP